VDGPQLDDKPLSLQPISAMSLAPCHLTSLGMRVALSTDRQHAMESLPWQSCEADCPSPGAGQLSSLSLQQDFVHGLTVVLFFLLLTSEEKVSRPFEV